MEFDNELLERILLDLKNAMKKDPFMCTFDILPVPESVQNKSPVRLQFDNLALESWCVKPLYVYTYNKYFDWKKKKRRVDTETLLLWTATILLINPEIETAWNTRKELICEPHKMVDELRFCELVISRKPKSSPIFAQRKWILTQLIKTSNDIPNIIDREFFLCSRAAHLYASNYYAWSHRSWIIQELLSCCLKAVSEELTTTDSFVSSHISDHSGFHYRQFLLSCYRKSVPKCDSNKPLSCLLHFSSSSETNECFSDFSNENNLSQWVEAIYTEMINIADLHNIYPGHESIWYHRRFLLHEFKLIDACGDISCSKSDNPDDNCKNKRHKSECDLNLNWSIEKEESFLNHRISNSPNNKWEKALIKKHLKWLKNTLKWTISVSLN